MRLIDGDALLEKAVPQNPDAQFHCVPVEDIETAPTIEERKTGRWEEKEVSEEKIIDEWQSARCSVCGKYHTTPYMYYFYNFNYCPNCGAKMEVSRNDRAMSV